MTVAKMLRDEVDTQAVEVPVVMRIMPLVPDALNESRNAPERVMLLAKRLEEVAFVVDAFVAKRLVAVAFPSIELVNDANVATRLEMKELEVVAFIIEELRAKRFVAVAFVVDALVANSVVAVAVPKVEVLRFTLLAKKFVVVAFVAATLSTDREEMVVLASVVFLKTTSAPVVVALPMESTLNAVFSDQPLPVQYISEFCWVPFETVPLTVVQKVEMPFVARTCPLVPA
jgi:hypothetical protein